MAKIGLQTNWHAKGEQVLKRFAMRSDVTWLRTANQTPWRMI